MILSTVLVLTAMLGTWSINDVRANESNSTQTATDNLGTAPETWSVENANATAYNLGLTVPNVPTKAEELYSTQKAFEKIPHTFEATFKLGADLAESRTRGGVLLGNYYDSNNASIHLEIYEYGHPRLYYNYRDASNNEIQFNHTFNQVQVCTGEVVRLTIVCDTEAGKIIAYLNGVKQQEIDVAYVPEMPTAEQVIGSAKRTNNTIDRFKGTIYDVTAWADVRTQEEIAYSSIKSLDKTDENLIAAFNFNTLNNLGKDLAGNGYDLTRTPVITADGVHTNASIETGLAFGDTPVYQTYNQLSHNLVSFSSWIQVPEDVTTQGVLFGNFTGATVPCIDIMIKKDGTVRFWHTNNTNVSGQITTDKTFDGTDVRASKWMHLALTIDEQNKKVNCYVNGVLKGQIDTYAITLDAITNGFVLGGDLRSGNTAFFNGRVKEVALYDDILTMEQVESLYMYGVDSLSKQPFTYYDVTNGANGTKISDAKGQNHLVTDPAYAEEPEDPRFYDKEDITDYAYSFAVVGDPQITTEYDKYNNTEYLDGIFDWIIENKESKNIQHVFGLGDITNNNSEAEWKIAQDAISQLDGQVPYTLVRGNHDLVGVKLAEDKTVDYYTRDIGSEAYKSQFEYGGFYSEENIWNAWRTFTVGETDYLVLALDFGASDDVLKWASSIVTGHPTHNVIVITHAYLETNGEPVDENGTCPPTHHDGNYNPGLNNGNNIWLEFVSQHENIVLVMSGHIPSEEIVVSQDKGVNGNTVTSMLINPQYIDSDEWNAGRTPTGMVTMLYFSEDGSEIKLERYSTAREKYFRPENEKTVQLNVVNDKIDVHENKVVPYSAEEAKVFIDGDNTTYPKNQEGYLFAGWYTDSSCDETCMLQGATPTGTVYALFVPKDVLSVKAQISGNLIDSKTTNDTYGSLRFVTSVDSLRYKEIGFDLSYVDGEGKLHSTTSASRNVYKKLYMMNGQSAWGRTPEGTFCAMSKYFRTCILQDFPMSTYKDIVFTIKPYWITMDGEKVYGVPETKSIQQGIDASTNVGQTQQPTYMAKLPGNYYNNAGQTVQWKDIYQEFSGYQVGETYVFSCDYYMPVGSHGSLRFRGASAQNGTVAEQGMYGGNAGYMEVRYTIQEGDVGENGYFGPNLVQYPGGEGYYWNLKVTKEGSDENLLTNADFAEGDGSWIGWKFGGDAVINSKEASDNATLSYGADIVAFDKTLFGNQCVAKMNGTLAAWKDVWQSFSEYEVGATYVFTCDYYMPEGSEGSIRFRGSSKGTVAEKGLAGGTRGTATVEYTVQEGDNSYFGPCMVQHPGGEGYFWNLRVTKKGSDENLLYNGDFKNTNGTWIGWLFGNDYVGDKEESDSLLESFGASIMKYGEIPFN